MAVEFILEPNDNLNWQVITEESTKPPSMGQVFTLEPTNRNPACHGKRHNKHISMALKPTGNNPICQEISDKSRENLFQQGVC